MVFHIHQRLVLEDLRSTHFLLALHSLLINELDFYGSDLKVMWARRYSCGMVDIAYHEVYHVSR